MGLPAYFRRLSAAFLLIVSGAALSDLEAETRRDPRGAETVSYFSRYAQIELALDRSLYRPGADLPMRFRVTNAGYRVLRIYPGRDPLSSYQFLVTDRQNREIPRRFEADRRARLERREQGERPVVDLHGDPVKEIILHPGETLEKTLYLNDFYELDPGREYRVIGYFYPEPRTEFFARSANTAVLRIDERRGVQPRERQESLSGLEASGVSPEETVYLFLSAEMQGNWKNYLKYLDLAKYVTAYDRFAGRYVQADVRERAEILRAFADYLTSSPADRLRRFRILSGRPERTEDGDPVPNGRYFVTASARREAEGYNVRYEYTFTLERGEGRGEGMWRIVYVEARLIE